METVYTRKPPAHEDWHPADVVAAVRKSGSSLRRLSILHGYQTGGITKALRHPWPNVERIIADQLGMTPADIWPSRYNPDGTPKRGEFRGRRGRRKGYRCKSTSRRGVCHVSESGPG